ncbi:MAG: GtrA family protein [Alphaproteobacteria bacterium]|nr:GtrA family protein [Alphaproteobacteria bacterium]
MSRMPNLPPTLAAIAGPLRPLLESRGFAQLVRFAIGGLAVTLLSVLVYVGFAYGLRIHPLAANTLSYGAGLAAGYAVHSRWSFRGDRRGEDGTMVLRFLVASGFAFTLNSFWVWLTTIALHLSPLAPVPAMMFVTPLMSFVLNRWWVFRAA